MSNVLVPTIKVWGNIRSISPCCVPVYNHWIAHPTFSTCYNATNMIKQNKRNKGKTIYLRNIELEGSVHTECIIFHSLKYRNHRNIIPVWCFETYPASAQKEQSWGDHYYNYQIIARTLSNSLSAGLQQRDEASKQYRSCWKDGGLRKCFARWIHDPV